MEEIKIDNVDLKNLILNENAYFYKIEKEITQSDIRRFFRSSRDEKKAKIKYNEKIRQ